MIHMIRRLFKTGCTHDWSPWEPYGFTYQRRHCKKCGRVQDAST
jgi:hypothetical protein